MCHLVAAICVCRDVDAEFRCRLAVNLLMYSRHFNGDSIGGKAIYLRVQVCCNLQKVVRCSATDYGLPVPLPLRMAIALNVA